MCYDVVNKQLWEKDADTSLCMAQAGTIYGLYM
jgi:hypothetical protein